MSTQDVKRIVILLAGLWAVLSAFTACQPTIPTATATATVVTNPISDGQTVQGNLAERDTHWLFAGQTGDTITLSVAVSQPPSVVILSPDGQSIARLSADASGLENIHLPANGVYTIVVGPGTGRYSLSLHKVIPDHTTPTVRPTASLAAVIGNVIALNESHTGTFTPDHPLEWWVFEGIANQVITIRMAAVSGTIEPVLTLLGPDKTTLITDQNGGGEHIALIGGFKLLTTGRYYIQVSGSGQSGDYRLSVETGAPPPTATPIIPTPTLTPTVTTTPTITPTILPTAFGGTQLHFRQPIQGIITDPRQIDQFAVFGPAGSTISIGMFPLPDSKLVPSFELYAPNGQKVLEAADPSAALVNAYVLPVTGAYVVYAHGYKNQSAGGYTVIAGEGYVLRDLDGGTIQPGIAYQGAIAQSGDRDVRGIDLPLNAIISVEAQPMQQSKLAMTLDIIQPDGKQLLTTSTDATDGISLPSITVPLAGRYLVRISAVQNQSRGAYLAAITIRSVIPTATFDLNLDKTIDIQLAQGGRYITSFQGLPGEIALIEAHAKVPGTFDPIIELDGPDGKRLFVADDVSPQNTDAVLQVALNDGPGTYTIQVYGYAFMPGSCTLHLKTG